MGQSNNLAFVFPGQGSQSIAMLSELADHNSEVKEVFARASEVLHQDLWRLCIEGPDEQLNKTENTQPVMLAAGFAVWEIWRKQTSLRPAWMAGHSLGEFTALVCAESVPFEKAVALVRHRALLMQDAVPVGEGAMAAVIGLDDPVIVDVCRNVAREFGIVAPANFNAPGQVVIAGSKAAVDIAIEALKEVGARRAVMLPVSVPSHCNLMLPAAEKLSEYLNELNFEVPKIPVVHNFDVASHSASDVIANVLTKQMYSPVRWVDSMRFLHDQGVTNFVECGPGKVLSGLVKRIVKNCHAYTTQNPNGLENAMENCE